MTTTSKKTGMLVVTRHGESEWNVLGKWTGWTDVGLTDKGKKDTEEVGKLIADLDFDEVYTSVLKRTEETLQAVIRGAGKPEINQLPKTAAPELNERHYGIYTGKNKWEVQAEVDAATFNGIRRGWDWPIPEGENLKQVYDRVVPYFTNELLPKLQAGENLLVVAHGNSIRALMKYLEDISDEKIADVEMPFGCVLMYTFEAGNDRPINKEVRQADIVQTHA